MSPSNDSHSSSPSSSSSAPSSSERDDYDNPWKEALDRFLDPFLAFFLPKAHRDIDWSHPPVPLAGELRAVVRDAEQGVRRVDYLVRVKLRSGEEQLVLIHIEIQSQVDPTLGKRLYISCNRIYDRYDLPVVSLAVLGDRRKGWRPDRHGWSLWDFSIEARFPTFQLLDWQGREEELEADPNPFALVVLAHLKARETRGVPVRRLDWKMELMRLLFDRNYEKEDAIELFRILDWLLQLPDRETEEFRARYDRLAKEKKMAYMSSIERLARKEGLQEGLERERRTVADLVDRLLTQRFGDLPETARARLHAADVDTLRQWGERLLVAPDLSAVFSDPS